jgi:hypothetical protein
MAESFGNEFTIVEVTSDDAEPERQMWLAFVKPSQASTLVLAAVPKGWTVQVMPTVLTDKERRLFQEVNLKPGDVYKLPERCSP